MTVAASPTAPRRIEQVVEALGLAAEMLLVAGTEVEERAAALALSVDRGSPDGDRLARALTTLASAECAEPEVEWVRLFLHGRPITAHPFESFYRTGRLADPDVLSRLNALFTAAGVRPQADRPVAIDHLGYELELLALLLHGLIERDDEGQPDAGVPALATALLEDHLAAFVDAFAGRLTAAGPSPRFAALGDVLRTCVAVARGILDERQQGAGASRAHATDSIAFRNQEGSHEEQEREAPHTRRKEETRMRKTINLMLAGLVLVPTFVWAQGQDQGDETEKLRQSLQDVEERLEKVERQSALDRIQFTGDYRFEAHSIRSTVPDHYDGMVLQNLLVSTMFYMGATGQMPNGTGAINQFIASHYGDYLYFTNNLTFAQLKSAMASFPPELQQQLFGMLLPQAFTKGYDANNSILYTNRLRLRMEAPVAEDVTFSGRLSMYKAWGDSAGVQVFNGQANSFDIDGNTANVPNSDMLRVERAYFTWNNMFNLPMYLSIGRRPSTEGPPMNLRQDELRGGTPMGSLIDFQFDGITWGVRVAENSIFRLCYGMGYESGFGNGELLKQPADRLKDAQFLGANWDIWSTPEMLVQVTAARAFNLTDGFNGLIVLPNNPLTGQTVGAPVVMRFTPSANLGDMDIAGVLLQRQDGPFDWFVNVNYVKSHPDNVTTPFGGLFSDPFEVPRSHNGNMYYLGGRYTFNNDNTVVGLEYNHGSKYWFNFTPAQDDIIAPKTATRGNVVEGYLIHRINKRFITKLSYIDYTYDYSGSGWHIGAPKKLDSTPILGFPTYDSAKMLTLSMTARF